jgi:hypothetical protein
MATSNLESQLLFFFTDILEQAVQSFGDSLEQSVQQTVD